MHPIPVDEHTEEFEQLAGLFALDVLDGEERSVFEQHAATCERCRLMVRADREALANLSLVAPEMDPSPDFKARLLQRASDELQQRATDERQARTTDQRQAREPVQRVPVQRDPLQREPVQRVPVQRDPLQREPVQREPVQREPLQLRPPAAPPNVVPFWRRSPWLSALAAVFVLGIVTAGGYAYENQAVATYQLSGNAPGSAEVIIRRSGAAELDMHGVPDPGPGFVYEAWVIPPGKQPVAAGITPTGDATVPLPANVRGSTVAITREHGKVDAPTSTPLMVATVLL